MGRAWSLWRKVRVRWPAQSAGRRLGVQHVSPATARPGPGLARCAHRNPVGRCVLRTRVRCSRGPEEDAEGWEVQE